MELKNLFKAIGIVLIVSIIGYTIAWLIDNTIGIGMFSLIVIGFCVLLIIYVIWVGIEEIKKEESDEVVKSG